MSTRRARIKAVASLPVRRKNLNTNDNNKTKQNVSIDTLKSSEEASTDISKEQPINDAASVTTGGRSTRRQSRGTPTISEKAPLLTPTSLYRIVSSPILSPKLKSSPIKKITEPLEIPISEETSKRCESDSDTDFITIPIQENNIISPQKQSNLQTNNTYTANIGSDRELVLNGHEVDGVVDGIVPLQSVRKVPKSLDLLKNEIISENAEVLFDPIVPLPSPSKVRPKLRPVPRLAPLRRNSIQGSASESEDESRRMLLGNSAATPIPSRQRHDSHTSLSTQNSLPNREVSRVRNDSVCSVLSQATTQPTISASPIKEKHLLSKSKRLESSKRMSAIRRRQRSLEQVPKDSLTMYDLIFYNPPTNPIVHDKEEENVVNEKKEELMKSKEEELKKLQENLEDNVDDPPFTEPTEKAAPVPQIKLGPNGEIMLDEKSLVIEQTEGARKLSTSIIREGEWANSGKGKYTRMPRTADWCDAETVRFYRALAAVGTDFSMMTTLFPKRTRRDLKIKFKKEEKINGAQVDKALRAQAWDALRLEKIFKQERHEETLKADKERQLVKEQRQIERNRIREARARGLYISKAAKSVEIAPASRSEKLRYELTANEILEEAREYLKDTQTKKRAKKHVTANPFATQPIKIMPKVGIPAQVHPKSPHTVSLPTLKPAQKILPATVHSMRLGSPEMATITKVTPNEPVTIAPPKYVNPKMPSNIEAGSLVVLKVKDPSCTTKTMLQTYIADANGRLTPVAISQPLLSTVINYMNKGTPKDSAEPSSSQSGSTNNVTETAVSPTKSTQLDPYTIMQL